MFEREEAKSMEVSVAKIIKQKGNRMVIGFTTSVYILL